MSGQDLNERVSKCTRLPRNKLPVCSTRGRCCATHGPEGEAEGLQPGGGALS